MVPLDGNGGYDVTHYDIRLSYQPATDLLSGTTTILARTTQDLSQFNLDFLLTVTSVRVNNAPNRLPRRRRADGGPEGGVAEAAEVLRRVSPVFGR